MEKRIAVLSVLVLMVAGNASAQVRAGGELQVNTFTGGQEFANGTIGGCVECYGIRADEFTTRFDTHIDTTVVELSFPMPSASRSGGRCTWDAASPTWRHQPLLPVHRNPPP